MTVSFIDTVELSAQSITWLELLVAAALKGMLILVLAVALNFALRRASAASRHLVWSLALASLLALPILSFGLPSWQVPVLPISFAKAQPKAVTNSHDLVAPAQRPIASLPQGFETSPAMKEQSRNNARSFASSPEPASQQSATEPLNWASYALMIWITGALLILARLLIGTASVWWMARRARRITEGEWSRLAERLAPQVGLARPVTLLKSSRITMPVTCGVVRSAVLLPSDADEWTDERRQVVLLHELAHVKRRDCLTQALAQIACAVYWFNPLIWAAARQLRMERERACDDQVLDAGTKASDYADHLLDLARSFSSASCSSLAAVAIARRSQLEGRLLAILDPSLSRRGLNRIASMSVGLIVALVVLPLAAIRPSAQAQSQSSPRAEATLPITVDAREQVSAPESNSVSAAISQAAGYTGEHQLEQAAQARQAEMAQPAALVEDEPGDRRTAEQQATKSEQRDNSSTIEALIESLKDEDAEVRQHALFALTQLGGPRAVEALTSAVKDPDPDVREKAVWGLGIMRGDGMVDSLISALKDSHPDVRQKAAWSLGLKGNQRSIQPLVDALRDENKDVRHMAAWALGLKGNSQAVEPLMDALKDKDVEVRGTAAWALGLRGDKRAANALKAALKDEDKEVRQNAAWALGMLMMRMSDSIGDDDDKDVDIGMDVDSDEGNDKSVAAKLKAKARIKQN
jgi:HEAT repeat protein/beta-lactamase regulating signal transducer with metallopeptidase domain